MIEDDDKDKTSTMIFVSINIWFCKQWEYDRNKKDKWRNLEELQMNILITSFLTITTFTKILTIKQDWSDVMFGESSIHQRPKDTPDEKEIFHLLVK